MNVVILLQIIPVVNEVAKGPTMPVMAAWRISFVALPSSGLCIKTVVIC